MLYLIILILILIITLSLIIKDKVKLLKILSISTIVSSFLIIIVGIILKYLILNMTTKINLSVITSILLEKFIHYSLILFIIGLIELLCTKIIKK